MKKALIAAFVIVPLSANGQTTPASKEAPSMQDQIRSDRAKYKLEFENGSKVRPWDRDANGKRPWDEKEAPPPKEKE
jgi:hypothetical protein